MILKEIQNKLNNLEKNLAEKKNLKRRNKYDQKQKEKGKDVLLLNQNNEIKNHVNKLEELKSLLDKSNWSEDQILRK